MLDMIKNGGIMPKKSPIEMILEDEYNIKLPNDIKTINGLNDFLKNCGKIEFDNEYGNNEGFTGSSYHNHKQYVDGDDYCERIMTY